VDAVPEGKFVVIDMSTNGEGEWQKWNASSFFGGVCHECWCFVFVCFCVWAVPCLLWVPSAALLRTFFIFPVPLRPPPTPTQHPPLHTHPAIACTHSSPAPFVWTTLHDFGGTDGIKGT
jgi:hypothetical protein